MNKFVTAFLIFFHCVFFIYGQSLKIDNINSDGYPNILVEFKVFDKDSNEVRNFNVNDFEILEDTLKRIITSVMCPPANQTKFSLILTIDISYSMSEPSTIPGKTKMDIVREAARNAIKSLPPDSNRWEAAITLFDFTNELVRGFTNSKWWLQKGLDTFILTPRGGTDYNAAFLYDISIPPRPGALLLAREARYKPIVIFLTDGKHEGRENPPPSRVQIWTNQILDSARKYNVTIYAITLGFPVPSELNAICSGTPYGQAYQSVPNEEELSNLYSTILNTIGTIGAPPPCRIRFNSDCEAGNVKLIYKPFAVSDSQIYNVNPIFMPKLEVSPNSLSFLNLSSPQEIPLSIKARNNKVVFNSPGIFSQLGNVIVTDWGGNPPPFTLERDSIRNIKIQFNPFDDNQLHTFSFAFNSSACSGNEVPIISGAIFAQEVDCGSEIVGITKNISQVPIFCNNWNEPITIFSVRISGGDQQDFKLIGSTTNIMLPANSCLNFDISFTPSQPTYRESFLIFDTQKGRFQSKIFGNGGGTPEIATVSSLNFPDVDCKYPQRDTLITIRNTGVLPLIISNFAITGTHSNSFAFLPANPGTITIQPNDVYQLGIRFDPITTGLNNAALEITSNAQSSPNVSIQISGFKSNRNFSISKNSIDFGTICPNEEHIQTITIFNNGNVNVQVNISSSNVFSILNPTPIELAPSSSFDLQISAISPLEGNYNGTLKVIDSYCNNEVNIPLQVGVVSPKIDRTPIPISGIVGLVKDTIIKIKNVSSRMLSISSAYLKDPQITISAPNLPWTIPSMSSLDVNIRYTPNTGGVFSTYLVLEGSPCNFKDSIQISSNPIASRADLFIGNYKGLVGEVITIPIEIRNGILLDKSGTTKIRTQLTYDETILKFISVSPNSVVTKFPNNLLFDQIPFDPNSNSLIEISFEVLNSNNLSTTLTLSNTTTIDGFIKFNETSGNFEILPSKAEISVGNVVAKTGEDIILPIYLRKLTNVSNFHQSISTELSFNTSLMEPIPPTPMGKVENKITTIKIESLPVIPDKTDSTIAKLRFRAKLGNAESSEIKISNTKTQKGFVRFEENAGRFTLINICQSGGPRLFDPWGNRTNLQVQTNPQTGEVLLKINVTERGPHLISLYNLYGKLLINFKIYFPNPIEEILHLPSYILEQGIYLIVLETPTEMLKEKFVLLR
ncbi:MAG: choice-of-anchor D domain-containing protein [Candidatus Kapaibacteriales bacterium]